MSEPNRNQPRWNPRKWHRRKQQQQGNSASTNLQNKDWWSREWSSGKQPSDLSAHESTSEEWSHGRWQHSERWRKKRRYIFRRALRYFALTGLLVLGGMAVASFLITRYFGGNTHTAALVWMTGCTLSLALPLMAMAVAMRGYRGFATPLVNVMAAADSVAAGDLSARVPIPPSGEIGRLAKSFNHMAGELERNDQQRRNLTADVAHELRTPLHIIQGNLEGILDGVYEPTAEHINATLEETRSLARLVDDLRTLSMAEAGELPLVKERVDLAELLTDIETSFGSQAAAHGVTFKVGINGAEKMLVVNGDPGRLDQVLSNLTVNALRHTSEGDAISIVAELEEERELGYPIVRVEVRDSGEGIPATDLPYIFDRFWRGNLARTQSRTGAGGVSGGGLGLAIVRQLVHAHDGTIVVDSEEGHGTLFQIRLPLTTSNGTS